MNINPKIEQIFKDFEVDGKQIPIFFMNYSGKSDIYLTYYTWIEKPLAFSDDEYQEEISHITIDVWSKTNYKQIAEAVKQKLKNNNFMWTNNGPESYESDTKYYHLPMNFYIDSTQLVN
ncbi:MAG: hypothetical protein Pg6B_04660 [Candidatus Azobacteroides pseudotrichonymphae]|nr:MAG: hypothetical protein Pg6B_04660 [Candidatus Azobacteroides pseudotrichonymphae]